jgi:hypothetical protein
MNEQESIFQTDGQGASTPAHPTGLRASNTVETLRPREINVGSGEYPFLGTFERNDAGEFKPVDNVRKTDIDFSPKYDTPLQGRGLPPQGFELQPLTPAQQEAVTTQKPSEKVWPGGQMIVNQPTQNLAIKQGSASRHWLPLSDRVARIEEQLDGLLDRIAAHNVKSSHKI